MNLHETFFINVEGKVAVNHCEAVTSKIMNAVVNNLLKWKRAGELTNRTGELGGALTDMVNRTMTPEYARVVLRALTDGMTEVVCGMSDDKAVKVAIMARYSVNNIVNPLQVGGE